MSRVILVENPENAYLDKLASRYKDELNDVLNDLREFYDVPDRDTFLACFRNLEQRLKGKAIKELKINTKGLKSDVLANIVELPEGADNLISKVERLKGLKDINDVLSCLDFENDSLQINNEKLEVLKDRNRLIATTPEQIERFKKLDEIAQQVNELGVLSGANILSLNRVFRAENGELKPNPLAVLNGY